MRLPLFLPLLILSLFLKEVEAYAGVLDEWNPRRILTLRNFVCCRSKVVCGWLFEDCCINKAGEELGTSCYMYFWCPSGYDDPLIRCPMATLT